MTLPVLEHDLVTNMSLFKDRSPSIVTFVFIEISPSVLITILGISVLV